MLYIHEKNVFERTIYFLFIMGIFPHDSRSNPIATRRNCGVLLMDSPVKMRPKR